MDRCLDAPLRIYRTWRSYVNRVHPVEAPGGIRIKRVKEHPYERVGGRGTVPVGGLGRQKIVLGNRFQAEQGKTDWQEREGR